MLESILSGYILVSIALWRMGGAGVPPLGTGWRRYVLPAVTMGMLLYLNVPWWQAVSAGVVQVIVNSLGYGDSSPLWKKTAVSASLGLPAVVLTSSMWWAPLWTLVHFGGYYFLSRKFNWFSWFIVEMVAGFSQGTTIVMGYLMIKQFLP